MTKDIAAVKALLRAHKPKPPLKTSSEIVGAGKVSKEFKACLKILRTVVKPLLLEYDNAVKSAGYRSSVVEPALAEMPNSIGLWIAMDVPAASGQKFTNVSNSRIAFQCLPSNAIEVTVDVTNASGNVSGWPTPVPDPMTTKWMSTTIRQFVTAVMSANPSV